MGSGDEAEPKHEGQGALLHRKIGCSDLMLGEWFVDYGVPIDPAWSPEERRARLEALEAEAEFTAVRWEFDCEFGGPEEETEDDEDRVLEAQEHQFQAPTAAIACLGDATAHGTPLGPGPGSPNVLVGGKPAFRAWVDVHTCPQPLPYPHVGGIVLLGEPRVRINGFPAVRMGDSVVELAGLNPIITGNPRVLAGQPAGPVTWLEWSWKPVEKKPWWERAHEKLKEVDDAVDDFIVDHVFDARLKVKGSGALARTKVGAKGGLAADVDDRIVGVEGQLDAEHEGFHGEVGVQLEIVVLPSIAGWSFSSPEWSGEISAGTAEAHGDVLVDPVQRRAQVGGDASGNLLNDDWMEPFETGRRQVDVGWPKHGGSR